MRLVRVRLLSSTSPGIFVSSPGFVDVEDVLPQDEYRERFPDGDSGMPYVFVCNNPHELIVRYPMKVRRCACARTPQAAPPPPRLPTLPPCPHLSPSDTGTT